ncbi:LacI family DNA-binding transcriptional regulator [Cellulomonas endophytica]|uniref:LacI family DNA-binding transcriptional regulator n=1 Tax=Cellulomonas endophytica TaxID=2494735 RepID=UPI0013E96A64|nr:substrate-binding domain-containing protein [Cellulomonas endophytica]
MSAVDEDREAAAVRVGVALLPADEAGALEPFYADLLAGMEERLDGAGASVVLVVVPEVADQVRAYRRWAADGLVDAVLVSDLVDADPRGAACAEAGLPAVVLGGEPGSGWVVDYDNAGAMRTAVGFLVGLGHRRLGRVSGPQRLRHTRARGEAFRSALDEAGAEGTCVEGDYGTGSGRAGTAALLDAAAPPTAIVYDNDLMALGGLEEAARRGLRVPEDLSLLAWDDSAPSRTAHPPLSVVSRDVHELGALTAEVLLGAVAGEPPQARRAPGARVVARGSTAPPPPA